MYDIGRHFFRKKQNKNERMVTAARVVPFDDDGTERSERVDAKTTDVYRKRNETILVDRNENNVTHSLND